MHERISGRPRDAVFKCLSDPTVPLSVWIVPITTARGLKQEPLRFHEVKHMTLLPVSINLVDQSNPSNRADPRLLTQQEFAHLLELANDAVRSEALDAQDREQAEYMKNNATWD